MKNVSRMTTLYRLLFAFFVVLLFLSSSFGQTKWKGTTSTDWFTSSNWTGGVPSSSLDVVIGDRTLSRYPVINSSARCKSITMGGTNTGSLTVNANLTVDNDATINNNGSIIQASGTSITVQNNVTINAGGTLTHLGSSSLTFSGDFNSSGTFNSSSTSTVTAAAAFGTQTISGTNLIFNNFTLFWFVTTNVSANLVVNNTLTLSPWSVLDLGTSTLSGTINTVSSTGTLKTQNISVAPIPAGLTWPGTVYYNGTSGQTIVNSNYTSLDATGGNRTFNPTGTIRISGTFTPGSGTYSVLGSTVEFNGTSAQNIPSCLFHNLTVSNPAGVTLTGSVKISNSLGFGNVNNSVITTTSFLTLTSSASNTANLLDITNSGVNTGNNISGTVTIERYVQGKRAYRFLTVPVNSSTSIKVNWMENTNNTSTSVNNNPLPNYGTHITGVGGSANGFDITTTNNPSLFTFNSTSQSWSPAANTNGLFSAGNGFRIMVRGSRSVDLSSNDATPSATTLRATGILVTGTVTMTKAGAGGTAGMPQLTSVNNAYSYIANPYASSVDWLAVDKTNISSTIYVFDPTVSGSNGRGAFVAYNGLMNSNSNGYSLINNHIQSGQAFFVQTTGSNPSLTFKEQYKSTTFHEVFRTANDLSNLSVELLLPSQVGTNGSADGARVYFSDDFPSSIGDEDSYKFTNQDENIAILSGSKTLSIEGRNPVRGSDSVSLKIWQLTQKNYTLKVTLDKFDNNVEGYLEDKYLHTSTPLNSNSETLVPFSITSDAASNAADRFNIVFETLATLPVRLTGIKAYIKNKGVQVEWTSESESNIDIYEVERSADAQHFETIASAKAKNNPTISTAYNAFDINPQVGDNYYRIKSIDISKGVKISEIVKVRTTEVEAGIKVFPNPVRGNTINIVFTNLAKASYSASLINGSGQKVYTGNIIHNGGTENHTMKIEGVLPKGIYQLQVSARDKVENVAVSIQ